MVPIICALCKENQRTKILYPSTLRKGRVSKETYSARRQPDRVHYRILRCERCGLIFSSPIFPSSTIAMLYKKSTCSYEEQIPFLTKTYFKLYDAIASYLPKNPRILEIGCGNGFFLDKLYQKGIIDVFGVEPAKDMVLRAPTRIRNNITNDIFKKNQFPKNTFDIVCSFHTLDHVTDPNMFVSEVSQVVKRGGSVLFVVHDTNGLSVKLFGEKSPIFDIEHIFLFNKKTLTRLCTNNGFSTTNVFSVVNTYPLSYWIHMSPFPAKLKHPLLQFLHNYKRIDISVPIPAGNIAIIARKV